MGAHPVFVVADTQGMSTTPESQKQTKVMNSPAGIRDRLEFILARYEAARAGEPFGRRHPLWGVFRGLQQALAEHPAAAKRPTLQVKWSAGQGHWARIPWLALLDSRETATTQQGVYCILLFRQDLSGVYLTFNQGVTKPREESGKVLAHATLRRRAEDLREFCDDLPERGFQLDDLIDLRTEPGLGKDYEVSTVAYKLYEASEVPDDSTISEDLDALLGAYDRYLASRGRKRRSARSVRETRGPGWEQAWKIGPAMGTLIQSIEQQSFVFEPWQVAAYVTALRTKPFVILAGVSGTGKSRLPALVATATGGAARLVPVRPDWTDSADVLGYTDLQGNFREGALLEVARQAMEQQQRHCVCILDEMNLARVEHFFAEVLSRIEDRHPVPSGGYESDPLLGPALHTQGDWASVPLPPNLALVGTVNMDESAHGFSRKVLDRAFTLELSDVDLARWESTRSDPVEIARWPVSAWYPRAISLGGLRVLQEGERALIQQTVEILTVANRLLAPAALQVGYRTRDEMALFALHAAEIDSCFITRTGDRVDPLDLALHMKVLPRIIGGSGAVRRAVLGLLGWARGGTPSLSEAEARTVLEEWEAAGRPGALPGARYPRTAARLCLMWERFQTEGFTSFWA